MQTNLSEFETILRARSDVTFGTPATASEIAKAEEALGLSFPRKFREYLSRFGHLEFGGSELFGLGTSVPPHLELVAVTRWEREESGHPLAPDLVPILNDGWGNLYCVSAHGENIGAVVFWDHEQSLGVPPNVVASSLGEWLLDLLKQAP